VIIARLMKQSLKWKMLMVEGKEQKDEIFSFRWFDLNGCLVHYVAR
jgi:hypothetical protein